MVVYSISIATLIFSGQLTPFLSIGIGIGIVFLTAIVATVIISFTNSLPGAISDPQDAPTIILAIMAGEIAAQFPDDVATSLPTVIMAIAVTTCVVGGVYFLLGTFKLGNLVRFMPYPVIGGFLGGTGYLLAQGAFNVMTDQGLELFYPSCVRIGARSRLVGILVALICLLTLVMGDKLITLFPKPLLGGVLLYLGLSFLVEWVYDAWFKLPKTDYGIVTRHTLSGATYQSHAARSRPQTRVLQEEGDQIYILDLQGFLFFGTANTLLNRIQDRLQDASLLPLKYVVLNFQAVNGLDSSAVLSFVKLKQLLQQQDINLVLTHLSPTIRTQLKRGDCLLANDPVCQVFPDLDQGLEWCENDLLGVRPMRRARSLPLLLQLNDLFPHRDQAADFIDYLEEWDAETGEVLFQQGQVADTIHLIEMGQVTVSVVGAIDFFRHSPHQTTAIVDAPSTLYRLSTENFLWMEQEQPEIAAAFQSAVIQIVGDRLTWAYKAMADLLQF